MDNDKNEKEDQTIEMNIQNPDLECVENLPVNNASSLDLVNSTNIDNILRIIHDNISPRIDNENFHVLIHQNLRETAYEKIDSMDA